MQLHCSGAEANSFNGKDGLGDIFREFAVGYREFSANKIPLLHWHTFHMRRLSHQKPNHEKDNRREYWNMCVPSYQQIRHRIIFTLLRALRVGSRKIRNKNNHFILLWETSVYFWQVVATSGEGTFGARKSPASHCFPKTWCRGQK